MNKEIIEKAIKEAREKGQGKIISRDDIYNAIFKAGIRLVVEWGDGDCEHLESYKGYTRPRRACKKCWQVQKKIWLK